MKYVIREYRGQVKRSATVGLVILQNDLLIAEYSTPNVSDLQTFLNEKYSTHFHCKGSLPTDGYENSHAVGDGDFVDLDVELE